MFFLFFFICFIYLIQIRINKDKEKIINFLIQRLVRLNYKEQIRMSRLDKGMSMNSNFQVTSTQQSPSKKYQYYTGSITNSGISASTINNHRNSIEQRIANLQAKISQKYNKLGESRKDRATMSENYVPVNLSTNKNNQVSQKQTVKQPLSSQIIGKRQVQSNQKISRPLSAVSKSIYSQLPVYKPTQNKRNSINYQSQSQNQSPNANRYTKYNYLTIDNTNQRDKVIQTMPLDKYIHNNNAEITQTRLIDNRYNVNAQQTAVLTDRNKDIGCYKTLDFNKRTTQLQQNIQLNQYPNQYHQISNQQHKPVYTNTQHNHNNPSQNNIPNISSLPFQKPYNRIKNQVHSLPKTTLLLSSQQKTVPHIQQQFTKLNKTISSLRKQPKIQGNFMAKQNIKDFPQKIIPSGTKDKQTQIKQNSQLYQMMKTILLGQQRLQKQLQIIKNKQLQAKNSTIKQQNSYQKDFDRLPLRQKKYTNPKITQLPSYHKPNINSLATSPLKNNKQKSIKSPFQKKNINDKENPKSQQSSENKQRRCNSAAQSKNKTGKITKNIKQQQFMQLYKQAQRQKHLSPLNSRIGISQQAVSSVWDRIKSVIQRSSVQDIESSKINHQNNRYINDHLVNSIQLQRRLKNDLVKKVYDMCENKCLFK